MMLKKINVFFCSMILVSLVFSCTPDKSVVNRTINEPAAAGGWTVMVWLDADNNLEFNALQDLNEMEYGLHVAGLTDAAVTDKVKIIVQVDRIDTYDNSTAYTGKDWSDTRRYIIRPDPADSTAWTSQRIDNDMGEVNMGDAAELRDFTEYCREHFPAENYALILWNHGGGLMKKVSSGESDAAGTTDAISKNICTDDTDDDQLYTGEITDVLTDAHSVQFLGFDACLMGMIEVAYEYRPGVTGKFGADAICFSPAEEQGDGWDYVRILTRLKGGGVDAEGDACYDAVSLSANQFATLCAEEYADGDDIYSGNLETQTAVDNTLVNNVKAAMDAFAAAIAQVSEYKSVIEGIRGSGTAVTMQYFNDGNPVYWKNYPFYDLYDFAERVNASTDLTEAHDEASALMTAVSTYILYSYAGSNYSGFTNKQNGLSFFFTEGEKTYTVGTEPYSYSYLHGYTSYDVSATGVNYGKLDFCEKGSTAAVDNWYELMMEMYMTTDLLSTGFWPDPAY